MGWDDKSASEVTRISFGADTDATDVTRFIDVWSSISARSKIA
jgi:cysteine sulfinate desulfinase/cysteine desulfurase-like protein